MFPFTTIDDFLVTCSDGLQLLSRKQTVMVSHDIKFSNTTKMKPVILITAAVRSLSPENYINEDVVDLSLK